MKKIIIAILIASIIFLVVIVFYWLPDMLKFAKGVTKDSLQRAAMMNGLEMLQIQADESWKIWNSF